jgi:hypothetical protein
MDARASTGPLFSLSPAGGEFYALKPGHLVYGLVVLVFSRSGSLRDGDGTLGEES